MRREDHLVTISHNGHVISTDIYTTKESENQDSLFWNLRPIIDPAYDLDIVHLGPYNKPGKLIPINIKD